jgi:hypothetical protein
MCAWRIDAIRHSPATLRVHAEHPPDALRRVGAGERDLGQARHVDRPAHDRVLAQARDERREVDRASERGRRVEARVGGEELAQLVPAASVEQPDVARLELLDRLDVEQVLQRRRRRHAGTRAAIRRPAR